MTIQPVSSWISFSRHRRLRSLCSVAISLLKHRPAISCAHSTPPSWPTRFEWNGMHGFSAPPDGRMRAGTWSRSIRGYTITMPRKSIAPCGTNWPICSPSSGRRVAAFLHMDANGKKPAVISASRMKRAATACLSPSGNGRGVIFIVANVAAKSSRASGASSAPWPVSNAAENSTADSTTPSHGYAWWRANDE